MKKNIIIVSIIIFLAVLVQIILSQFEMFENLELKLYDLRSQIAGDTRLFGHNFYQADKDIVIVAIDDYSKKKLMENPSEELGPWPWHRDVWNKVIDFIQDGQPTALMFDMVFENLSENTWHDRRFAQKLRQYNNIVLGTYLDNPKGNETTFTQSIETEPNENTPTAKPLNVIIDDKKLEDAITYYANAPVHDMYTLDNTMGVVNKILDSDSSIRRTRPIFKLVKNGETYYMPSLSFAAFMKYMGEDGDVIIKNKNVYYKGRIIPLNDKGIVKINWHKSAKNYTYIPISKILLNEGRKNDLKSEFFKNKLVIIGKTAAGTRVDLNSIIDPSYTSPEATAAALDNFMNDTSPKDRKAKKFLREIPKPIQFLITALACALVAFIGLSSKSAFAGCLNGVFSILLYIFFCFWLFVHPSSRLILPIAVPLYYLAITSGVVFAYRFYKEINKKTSIMNTFGKFVSPRVLSNVVKNPENLVLKSTKKRITILFCDVKDFSSLCEKNEPEKLITNLNEFFKEIVNIIFENNGTVDKFIGDCIMAYWGDFSDSEDDEFMAVKTALAIKKRVNELKIQNAKENKIIFDVKIGINTGEAILGLAGTDRIMSYTAMGDAVNVASRLESSCSLLDKDILISKSTYEAAKDKIVALGKWTISIKGKEEQVEVYEPIGLTEEVKLENQDEQL